MEKLILKKTNTIIREIIDFPKGTFSSTIQDTKKVAMVTPIDITNWATVPPSALIIVFNHFIGKFNFKF